ncbi:MAG: cell wall hydrolase [Rhodocyclaceae bacterium]|nr:cell wall hydrolase [Rhodocyclaceae bacterium]MBX3667342.1 cell wall hydrolase [Rhodocyclaceae bacterium]
MRPRAGIAQALHLDNRVHGNSFGTVGALLQAAGDSSKYFVLTAGHVLAISPQVRFGDSVNVESSPPLTASLFDWEPSFGDVRPQTDIDAAIARISEAGARTLAASGGQPLPAGFANPASGMAARLRVARGDIAGTVVAAVSGWMSAADGADTIFYFIRTGWLFDPDEPSVHGDSGAAIWSADDRLIGICCGAAPDAYPGKTLFIPLGPILDRFKVVPVLRGHFGGGLAERDGTELRPGVRPAAIASAPSAPTPPPVFGLPLGADAARAADVLARTLWGEARGEPERVEAMSAVAWVVLNRVRKQTWWGKTVVDVCLKPFQFSCWNPNDRNRPRLLEVRSNRLGSADQQAFADALDIAQNAVSGALLQQDDPTRRATHYHSRFLSIYPTWARGHKPCEALGNHLFYNDVN